MVHKERLSAVVLEEKNTALIARVAYISREFAEREAASKQLMATE
jgi:hypothetical protein